MTTVVTDNCQLCRFTDCVEVCPVECIPKDESNQETEEQLWEKYRNLIAQAKVS